MQFPEIPDKLPTPVKNRLNKLRRKYGKRMVLIRFEPQRADELLSEAGEIVAKARRILGDQDRSLPQPDGKE